MSQKLILQKILSLGFILITDYLLPFVAIPYDAQKYKAWQLEICEDYPAKQKAFQTKTLIGFSIAVRCNENLWGTEKRILLANRLTANENTIVFLIGSTNETILSNPIVSKTNKQVISHIAETILIE